jgi:hypothetical protein
MWQIDRLIGPKPPHLSDPTVESSVTDALGSMPSGDELEGGFESSEGGEGSESKKQVTSRGVDWLSIAKETYLSSTSYFDSNHRKRIEDGIRAFNSQHSQGSKYLDPAYSKRSNIYHPKFRAIVRKNEAAGAAALFSNSDVTDIQAENQSDPQQRASAEIVKAILQYRLEKTIPWFRVCMGALQDAHKTGSCVARVYWEFEQGADGSVRKDMPKVELFPLENFRIDPAADWTDPVGTSPYLIHLMPMYVCDVMERMLSPDPKTGRPEWRMVDEQSIRNATQTMPDSTRAVREKNRADPYDGDRPISDYTIVWIQRHIHRRNGQDWEFYTLGDQALLTDPQPLEKSTWHGQRDYVMGQCILETHVSMPSSMHELGKNLFDEINELKNQRADNVKLVLNKRWIIKRNKNVDAAGLSKNVPGAVISADDPEGDVREINWPDVTASSFQEADQLAAETDELMGNFNAANLPRTGSLADTVHGAEMLTAPSSMLTEYMLRTFVETFVLPVLKLLIKLEQCYETDEVVFNYARDKVQLYQKFGINQITDSLLNQELTVRVNVGMGAVDPQAKLQKFIYATMAFAQMVKAQVPGFNLKEVAKEIYSHAGYQDGTRFMTQSDPNVADLQQKLQQAMQFIQQLGKQVNDKNKEMETKIEVAKIAAGSRVESSAIAHPHGMDPMRDHALKGHEIALKHEAKLIELDAETKKFIIETMAKMQMHRDKVQVDREKMHHQSKMQQQRPKAKQQ